MAEGVGEAEATASGFGLDWDVDFEAAVCLDLDRIEEAMNAKKEATQLQPSIGLAAAPQQRLEEYMLSFSPPRELSQSFPVERRGGPSPERKRVGGDFYRGRRNSHAGGGVHGGKDQEIENLKKGMKSMHEKLICQEHECTELLKDRDKKIEDLKIALAQITEKDVEIRRLKQICKHQGTLVGDHPHAFPPSDHAVKSSDRNDVFPDFDTGGTTGSQWIRGKASKRLFRDTSNLSTSVEKSSLRQLDNSYQSQESELPNDLSMVSDLKARLSIGGASNAGTHCKSSMQVEENVCRETTAKPKFTKTVGIQTDICADPSISEEGTMEHHVSNKLIKLWRPSIGENLGQKLVRKLFASHASDLISLFKLMGLASTNASESGAEETFSNLMPRDCSYQAHPKQDTDCAKFGSFYLVLTKVMNDMAQLDSLLEALVDLCCLRNVDIVHRSLRIIHSVLHHALIFYSDSSQRSNIVVNHLGVSKIDLDAGMPLLGRSAKWTKEVSEFVREAASPSQVPKEELLYTQKICERGNRLVRHDHNFDLVAVFEKMHQIVIENTNHQIQLEAISIMNLIMMRSSPVSERNKYGTVRLLESISLLLQKRAALVVQLQAVRLLFLLLNCEEAMLLFCGGLKHDTSSAPPADDALDSSSLPACCSRILEGLTECVSCIGESPQELVLRRHGIRVLAFIMATGEAATKILDSGAFGRTNLLELLVKVLTSELDAQEADCKERISLIREALILLCRLVSHPIHSAVVLGALASSKNMLRSLVDVAHRIIAGAGAVDFQKGEGSRRKDVNQADLVGLARVLKSRTSPLLGRVS
ncbi:unnamed protein product [Victoria cruziana]